jgi:hypothetical protein
MARYRPISPEQTWRSADSCDLTISERYGELYLLTSPFTNTIGCYRVVSRIAAAEMGLSQEEFINVVQRLQDRGVIVCVDDFILVRTWFRHNSWEATFSGNVAKAAAKELASLPDELRALWVRASLDGGVPEVAVRGLLPDFDITTRKVCAKRSVDALGGTREGLDRDLPAPSKEPPNYNNNENNNETKNTTPTQLIFDDSIESHRKLLSPLLVGVEIDVAQAILDELVGALESVKRGNRRKPIGSVRAWVAELVKLAKSGRFDPELAPIIRARREREHGIAEIEPAPTARPIAIRNMVMVKSALASGSTRKRGAS